MFMARSLSTTTKQCINQPSQTRQLPCTIWGTLRNQSALSQRPHKWQWLWGIPHLDVPFGKCWSLQRWYYSQHLDIYTVYGIPVYSWNLNIARYFFCEVHTTHNEYLKNKSRVVDFDGNRASSLALLISMKKGHIWKAHELQSPQDSMIHRFSWRWKKPGEFEKYLLCQIKIPRRIPASIWSESQNAAWAWQRCQLWMCVSIRSTLFVSVLGPRCCF